MHLLALSWDVDRPGWIDPALLALAGGLQHLGVSCEVVTTGAGPTATTRLDGIEVTRASEPPPVLPPTAEYDLGRVLAASTPASAAAERRCRARLPDAVLAFGWQTGWTATTIRSTRGLPLVAVLDSTAPGRGPDGELDDLGRMAAQIEWWLTYESRAVVATSDHVARSLRKDYRLPPGKVTVVPPAVVPGVPRAGHRVLVAAPDAVVEAVAEAVGRRHVHRPGTHPDDLADTGMAIVLDDQRHDVVLAAMAAGVAVVVPEDGPLRGLVDARSSGVRTSRDPAAVAAVAGELHASPARRRRLGQRALERVQRRHAPGAVARQVEAIARRAGGQEATLQQELGRPPLRPILLRSPILGLVTDDGLTAEIGRHPGTGDA